MTAKEMIERLQQLPPDTVLVIVDGGRPCAKIVSHVSDPEPAKRKKLSSHYAYLTPSGEGQFEVSFVG